MVLSENIQDNHQTFFSDFTKARVDIESALIEHKELIAAIFQFLSSKTRIVAYSKIFRNVIEWSKNASPITQDLIVEWGGVKGKLIVGSITKISTDFSDEDKSKVFIREAIKSAPKCPICNGYLDSKSMSYDHVVRVRDGGLGDDENCQITHPYCNQSIKN